VRRVWSLWCAGISACAGLGCGQDERSLDEDARPVIEHYAASAYAGYSSSVAKAEELQSAVDGLVSSPSATTLQAARQAWLAAREPYGQTEVYRFYDGPIDDPTDGPEGLINAWPLDEAYIDYVDGDPSSGIINHPTTFPTLSKELLASENEKGGEKNISTGYHAIEFLLWGQDLNAAGPGNRPHTDYVIGGDGTAAHPERRGQYLRLAAELLADNLRTVRDAWAPGASNYGLEFRALGANEALRRILQGMGSLSGAELAGERMTTAYDNRDQEDEHSCFSDNTHRDLYLNALAVQNVYLGRSGSTDGPGLDDVVRPRDQTLDAKMRQQLEASLAAVQAIPVPFDQALAHDDSRAKILTAVRALQAQTDTVVEIAALLGITLNLE
jgi:putative iron-regulated protein